MKGWWSWKNCLSVIGRPIVSPYYLDRSYLAHEAEQRPQFTQDAFERMLGYYQQLVLPPVELQAGDPYWNGLANYARATNLGQEWGNLAYLIRRLLDQQRYRVALELFLPVVHFLHIWGFWDERLQLSQKCVL